MKLLVQHDPWIVEEFGITEEQLLPLAGLDLVGGQGFMKKLRDADLSNLADLSVGEENEETMAAVNAHFEKWKTEVDYFLDLNVRDPQEAWGTFTEEMKRRLDISTAPAMDA